MEKFKFKPYNSSIDAGVFTMGNGYFESSGEADTRKQLSYPLSNIADYINDEVVPNVNESINSIQELRTDVKTTTDSLKNELDTCKNDVSLLNGRVDTVTSLPSGSTTGDAELADIRVGANGTTYPNAGGAVRGQINELKSDLVENDLLKKDYNLDVITGVVYRNTDNLKQTNIFINSKTTDLIEVDSDFTYYFSGVVLFNIGGVNFYNSNKEFISSQFGQAQGVRKKFDNEIIILPDDAKYFRASTYDYTDKDLSINKLLLIKNLIKNLIIDVDELSKNTYSMNFVYVSTTGNDITGDGTYEKPYATIYHANEQITDNSELNRYTIKVADGIYTDLQEKYAGNTNFGTYHGVICKPYVSYVGNVKNPSACKIEWDGSYGYDKSTYKYKYAGFSKCPFHITGESGHTEIIGFTIEAKNTRYAMHVETNGYGVGVDWLISDCNFIWHGTTDCIDRTDSPSTIGTGSGYFEKGHLLRCKITNDEGIYGGFMNHDSERVYDNLSVYEGANIIIESCVFNGGGFNTNVTFRNLFGDNLIDGFNRFSIINCTGIDTLGFQKTGTANLNWRAEIKCSEIITNRFTDDLMQ